LELQFWKRGWNEERNVKEDKNLFNIGGINGYIHKPPFKGSTKKSGFSMAFLKIYNIEKYPEYEKIKNILYRKHTCKKTI
jgi:hypothetical protein